MSDLRSAGIEIELLDGRLFIEMPEHVPPDLARVLRYQLVLQRGRLIQELEGEDAKR